MFCFLLLVCAKIIQIGRINCTAVGGVASGDNLSQEAGDGQLVSVINSQVVRLAHINPNLLSIFGYPAKCH